jgi:hypothetical protein
MPKVKKSKKPRHPNEPVARVYQDKNLLRLVSKDVDDAEQDEQRLEEILLKNKKREVWVEEK